MARGTKAKGAGGAAYREVEGAIALLRKAEGALDLRATLLDSASDAIYLRDAAGHFFYANKAACKLHGYTNDEFLKLTLLKLVDRRGRRLLRQHLQQVMKKGELTFEGTHVRKNGSHIPVEVHMRTIKVGGKKLILSVVRDITARKKAEEALLAADEELRATNEEMEATNEELRASDEELRATNEELRATNEEMEATNEELKATTEELKKSEQALKMRVELLDSAADAIYLRDAEGHFFYANKAACKLHGYAKEQFLKLTLPELVAKSSRKLLEQHIKQAMKKGELRFESTHVRKNGSHIPVEVHMRTIKVGGKKLILSVVRDITARKKAEEALRASEEELRASNEELEATNEELRASDEELRATNEELRATNEEMEATNEELRATSEELRKSEENLRQLSHRNELILGSAGEGILGVDLQGNITFINPAAAKMFGRKTNELMGKLAHKLTHHTKPDGKPYPREKCPIYAAYKDGLVHRVDTEVFWRKDGTSFPVEYASTPIKEKGKLAGAVVAFSDITERKKAENLILHASEELEKKVKERTAELRSANARLTEEDRTKSMFIASMSHELRTPLNSIIGFTGLLLQELPGELNDEQKKQLKMVKGSASQLLSLINDVIDVSKIEAEKIELDIHEFNLSEAARDVFSSLGLAAAEKGIKLSFDAPDRIIVESDERRVKQIITNFMSNAVKFSQKGEVTLELSVSGGNVIVSVRDQGIGVRKENIPQLFQAFSRIREEGIVQPEGVGLGLYLSKKLAVLLGGIVGASSTFGKGSEFKLTLPLKFKHEVGR